MPPRLASRLAGLAWIAGLAIGPRAAVAEALSPDRQLCRDIYEELVLINTTDSSGSTTAAAEAMAARLKAAGFPSADLQILGPHPRKGNLVARLRGTAERRPILLLAHLDVVEARREDWSFDPFSFREQDGYFYGRGTSDDKAMAAIFVANLIRYRREGLRPERDIVLALTADEEGGSYNGVDFLLKEHRPLIEADYGLNEGGGGQLKDGRRVANTVQASEKVFLSFRLEVKNPGGHSSLPVPENAIYRLAEGLTRLARLRFPARLNEVTRAFFTSLSARATGEEAADMRLVLGDASTPAFTTAADRLSERPFYNALLRTTCVATQLEGGHAENALPQTARAVVNCRMLPDESPAEVQTSIERVLGDAKIAVAPLAPARPSPASPLAPDVLGPIERVSEALFPGVPVIPIMSTGASDSLYLRAAGIPVYGVDGLFENIDDIRAHGKDERMAVASFFEGQEFLYRLVKALAARGPAGAP